MITMMIFWEKSRRIWIIPSRSMVHPARQRSRICSTTTASKYPPMRNPRPLSVNITSWRVSTIRTRIPVIRSRRTSSRTLPRPIKSCPTPSCERNMIRMVGVDCPPIRPVYPMISLVKSIRPYYSRSCLDRINSIVTLDVYPLLPRPPLVILQKFPSRMRVNCRNDVSRVWPWR